MLIHVVKLAYELRFGAITFRVFALEERHARWKQALAPGVNKPGSIQLHRAQMRILCNACGAPPAGDFGAGGKRGTRNFLLQSLHDHIRVGYVLPIQFDEWHSPLRTNL
jgi:hypothetical protein